jgi:UDP-2-acetamido-2,6-beta-L-arabino-hexul-4-ose reductase
MTTVLITGSNGFMGRNLRAALSRLPETRMLCFDVDDERHVLEKHLQQADIVFHLAGINRPQKEEEFIEGNIGLTQTISDLLNNFNRTPSIVFSSSTQASLENPYGRSKKAAEDIIFQYGIRTEAPVYVYRLTNVFGKWSRPNYNSVVSTFCYNISHGLDIAISNPANVVELVYIDDVIADFIGVLSGEIKPSSSCLSVQPSYRINLGDLAKKIYGFKDIRSRLLIPDFSDDFTKKLYATYLSYLRQDDFSYTLNMKKDNRGELAELIKSAQFGQIFVSRTYGGITRGNHYHDSKVEKFCVLQGEAAIRFRHIGSDEVIEYRVSGKNWEVLDIPPGYTHHIENLSKEEMIVLFWANQIFDPQHPDTYYREVEDEKA